MGEIHGMLFLEKSRYILIHQAGKVASQTVEAAIRQNAEAKTEVERHHYLSDKGLAHLESISMLPGIEIDGANGVRDQIRHARLVRKALENVRHKEVWVATGVRDPLDLSIAALFQNLPIYCPWLDYGPDKADRAAHQLIEFFNQQFDRMIARNPPANFGEALLDLKLGGPEPWFENEFKELHRIDVYDRRMKFSDGFFSFKEGSVNFLVYKAELISQSMPLILRRIGIRSQRPVQSINVGEQKKYSGIYSLFKKNFKPASHVIDYYYGGKFFRHFHEILS